jgi:hypothetical protein
MSNIVIGSHVWVEDKDLAWLDGEVFQIDGQKARIRTTKRKTVCATMLMSSLSSLFLLLWNLLYIGVHLVRMLHLQQYFAECQSPVAIMLGNL